MKKLILIIMCISVLALVGCGTKQDDSTLTDMENYLANNGLLDGNRIEPMAALIGAVEGFKYVGTGIEVYEYDIKSDAYKKLVKNKSVAVEGFGTELPVAAVNGKYVLFYSGDDSVVDVFKSFDPKDAPIEKKDSSVSELSANSEIAASQLSATGQEDTEPTAAPIPTVASTPTPKPTSKPTVTPKPTPTPAIIVNVTINFPDIDDDPVYTDEDLMYQRDIAERDFIDKFSSSTLTPDAEFIIIEDDEDDYDEEALTDTINDMLKNQTAVGEIK